jgi:NAD(P)H-dependent glutamate synthase small subunit
MKNIFNISKKWFSKSKPKDFLNKSKSTKNRNIGERIKDFEIISENYSKQNIINQASRCLDCGTPWCHVKPYGCPLNNYIPEWNQLIKNDDWEKAFHILKKTSNMSEMTGLVCPAPCESSCTLALATNDPVKIKNIEYAIINNAWEKGWIQPNIPKIRTNKKIAVIGSGPCGLSAADLLNQNGHNISVYEKDDKIGGLLMYGIPNMKLDKSIVDRRVNLLRNEGIEFIVNADIGNNYDSQMILDNYDAILLAIGSTVPRDLNIKGRNLNNIHFAMDVLKNDTKNLLKISNNEKLSTNNKKVIIIGGGDTATDCLASGVRNNCSSLVCFNRSEKPPQNRSVENPWPEPEMIYKIDYGHEEVIHSFGKDPREYQILVKEFIGNFDNNVKFVKTVNIDKNLIEIPDTEKFWDCDIVIVSAGYIGTEKNLLNKLDIEQNKKNNVMTLFQYSTNNKKIFAAGDCRIGQSLVVNAIDEGRRVSHTIDKFLS